MNLTVGMAQIHHSSTTHFQHWTQVKTELAMDLKKKKRRKKEKKKGITSSWSQTQNVFSRNNRTTMDLKFFAVHPYIPHALAPCPSEQS